MEYLRKMRSYFETDTSHIREEDFILLRRKEAIISRYAGEHLRAYTLKE